MKKIFSAIIILSVIFSISACGSSEPVKIYTEVWDKTPTKGDHVRDYYLIPNSVKGNNKQDFDCKVLFKTYEVDKSSGEKTFVEDRPLDVHFYYVDMFGMLADLSDGRHFVNGNPLFDTLYAKALYYL